MVPITLPKIIAHRGASHKAPENTLAAVIAAYHEAARWVEVDIKLAGDGQPFLMHDVSVNRTTNGTGRLQDLNAQQISKLDAGSWKDPAYQGEPVPSLEALLEQLDRLSMGVNLEIKPDPERAEATALAAISVVEAWVRQHHAIGILFSSFSATALATLAHHAPNYPRGLLLQHIPSNWQAQAERFGCWSIHVANEHMDKQEAEAIKQAGYKLVAYTINDGARAHEIIDYGVDSVITDCPKKISDYLNSRQ